MYYFPQLETGAMGQYPLVRARRSRTIENRMPGGASIRFADTAAQTTEWQLVFDELTDGEADTLRQFFETVEGRLNTFTFLDPTGNLLRWSEKLDEPVWEKGPLVTVSGGAGDPSGGTRAWRIGGPAGGAITQTLAAPGWFYYCLSLYARSEQETGITLVRGWEKSEQRVTQQWRRVAFPSSGTGSEEGVRFGLELQGGAVDVFGLQVEPQSGASGYKKTGSRGGVYQNARFGQDVLQLTAAGPGRHHSKLSVIHGERI